MTIPSTSVNTLHTFDYLTSTYPTGISCIFDI